MGRPIPHLERVLLDFPDLVVVGGHIGAPWLDEMIFLAGKCFGFEDVEDGTFVSFVCLTQANNLVFALFV